MGLAKKKLIVNSFLAAQFNYHSLIWMILIAILITIESNTYMKDVFDWYAVVKSFCMKNN